MPTFEENVPEERGPLPGDPIPKAKTGLVAYRADCQRGISI